MEWWSLYNFRRVGGAGDDVISGGNGADLLHGNDGDDTISDFFAGTYDNAVDIIFDDLGSDTLSFNSLDQATQ